MVSISLVFAVAVAYLARLTVRRRGPFAFVLSRLSAAEAAYVSVATMLWVVAIGIVGLLLVTALMPAHADFFARWAWSFFIVAPALVAAFVPLVRPRAP